MPSQTFCTNVLPKPMKEARRKLQLGDSRLVNEHLWETTYHVKYNETAREPDSQRMISALRTTFLEPSQRTTGFVLTSLSRDAVQELREQLLADGGIQAAQEAATIFRAADVAKIGIITPSQFVGCLESLGIKLNRHATSSILKEFGVKGNATAEAVDYVGFLCGVLPEAFNKAQAHGLSRPSTPK